MCGCFFFFCIVVGLDCVWLVGMIFFIFFNNNFLYCIFFMYVEVYYRGLMKIDLSFKKSFFIWRKFLIYMFLEIYKY